MRSHSAALVATDPIFRMLSTNMRAPKCSRSLSSWNGSDQHVLELHGAVSSQLKTLER